MMIRESTDMSATSADDELNDPGQDSLNFVGAMVRSKDITDQRLVQLFKLRQSEDKVDLETKRKTMHSRRKSHLRDRMQLFLDDAAFNEILFNNQQSSEVSQ